MLRSHNFFYFLKKYSLASLIQMIVHKDKSIIALIIIVCLGLFLRLVNIQQSMMFIGDQGWFYIAARDMLLSGTIPLIGITSSHTWLHQGALWTYLLGGWFGLFGFNPVNGAYLSALLDSVAIIFLYKLGREMFSRRLGVIAAALYATSPLVIFFIRMPYHTSPIPLGTILFIYFLYKWVSGKIIYFPLVIGSLAILYNLELATFVLSVVVAVVLLYGFWKKTPWALQIFQKKILLLTLLSFFIPMLPMILYDISHGFPQTLGFLAWVGYKILVVIGYPSLHSTTHISWGTVFSFSGENYMRLIFPANAFIATIIICGSLGFFAESLKNIFTEKKVQTNIAVLALITIIPIIGFFAVRTPSDAYLPMLFPALLLVTALFIDGFFRHRRLKFVGILLVTIICLSNTHFLITHNYTFYENSLTLKKRMAVAKQIVTEAKGMEYNLKGAGTGSQFISYTMNYEYLTWWLGHSPSKDKEPLHFIISEDTKGIHVKKEYD